MRLVAKLFRQQNQDTLLDACARILAHTEVSRVFSTVFRIGPVFLYSCVMAITNLVSLGESNDSTLKFVVFVVFFVGLMASLCYTAVLVGKQMFWLVKLRYLQLCNHPLWAPLGAYVPLLRLSYHELATRLHEELTSPQGHHCTLADDVDLFLTENWLMVIDLHNGVIGQRNGKVITTAHVDMARLRDIEYLILFPENTIAVVNRVGGQLSLFLITSESDMVWPALLARSAELRRAAKAFPADLYVSVRSLLSLTNPRRRPTTDMVQQSLRFMSLWMKIMDSLTPQVRQEYDAKNVVLTEKLQLVMSSLENGSFGVGSSGASQEAVRKLHEYVITSTGETGSELLGQPCSMCLEEFKDGDTVTLFACSKHAFHSPCIRRWLVSQHTCPLCRYSLPIQTYNEHDTPPSDSDEEDDELDVNVNQLGTIGQGFSLFPDPKIPTVPDDHYRVAIGRAIDPFQPHNFTTETLQQGLHYCDPSLQPIQRELAHLSQHRASRNNTNSSSSNSPNSIVAGGAGDYQGSAYVLQPPLTPSTALPSQLQNLKVPYLHKLLQSNPAIVEKWKHGHRAADVQMFGRCFDRFPLPELSVKSKVGELVLKLKKNE